MFYELSRESTAGMCGSAVDMCGQTGDWRHSRLSTADMCEIIEISGGPTADRPRAADLPREETSELDCVTSKRRESRMSQHPNRDPANTDFHGHFFRLFEESFVTVE